MPRNTRQTVVIGIDGGGTHSLAVAANSNGRVLALARAGSLNFFGSSLPTARRTLKTLVRQLRNQLPPGTQFSHTVIGCAALFCDATRAEKEKLCRGLLPLSRTRVISDCQTASFGATLGKPGVVLIAGTGSIVLARNGAGQLTRVGGWGHILGDAGSAYWIAVESVKAAIASQEGLGPKTELGSVICRWFEVSKLTEIVPFIHRADFAQKDFASLSSHLARRMGRSDAVFRGICRNAGRQLAAQTLAAAKVARLPARGLPIFLVGSVLTNNELVRASLIAALKAACTVRISKPKLAPALGAAAMALVDAGVETTAAVVANLSRRRSPGNRQSGTPQ